MGLYHYSPVTNDLEKCSAGNGKRGNNPKASRGCPYYKQGIFHIASKNIHVAREEYAMYLAVKNSTFAKKQKRFAETGNVTKDEVLMLMDRRKIDHEKLVGSTLAGSYLYNTHTPESDRDIFVILTEGSKFQKVYPDGYDVAYFTVDDIMESYYHGAHNIVDLVNSGSVDFHGSPYESFFNNVRFDTYKYLDRVGSWYINHKELFTKKIIKGDTKGAQKIVKSWLRTSIVESRVMRDGVNYRVRFTDSEKQNFYDILKSGEFYDDMKRLAQRDDTAEAMALCSFKISQDFIKGDM